MTQFGSTAGIQAANMLRANGFLGGSGGSGGNVATGTAISIGAGSVASGLLGYFGAQQRNRQIANSQRLVADTARTNIALVNEQAGQAIGQRRDAADRLESRITTIGAEVGDNGGVAARLRVANAGRREQDINTITRNAQLQAEAIASEANARIDGLGNQRSNPFIEGLIGGARGAIGGAQFASGLGL